MDETRRMQGNIEGQETESEEILIIEEDEEEETQSENAGGLETLPQQNNVQEIDDIDQLMDDLSINNPRQAPKPAGTKQKKTISTVKSGQASDSMKQLKTVNQAQ